MIDSAKYNITTWFGAVVILSIATLGWFSLLGNSGGIGYRLLLLVVCLVAVVFLFWMDTKSTGYTTRALMRKDRGVRYKLLPYVSDFETKRYNVWAYRYLSYRASFRNTLDEREFDYAYEDADLQGRTEFDGYLVGYVDDSGDKRTTMQPVIVKYCKDLDEPVLEVKEVTEELKSPEVRAEVNPVLILPEDYRGVTKFYPTVVVGE